MKFSSYCQSLVMAIIVGGTVVWPALPDAASSPTEQARILFKQAYDQMQLGNVEVAKGLFEAGLKLDPRNAEAKKILSRLNAKGGADNAPARAASSASGRSVADAIALLERRIDWLQGEDTNSVGGITKFYACTVTGSVSALKLDGDILVYIRKLAYIDEGWDSNLPKGMQIIWRDKQDIVDTVSVPLDKIKAFPGFESAQESNCRNGKTGSKMAVIRFRCVDAQKCISTSSTTTESTAEVTSRFRRPDSDLSRLPLPPAETKHSSDPNELHETATILVTIPEVADPEDREAFRNAIRVITTARSPR